MDCIWLRIRLRRGAGWCSETAGCADALGVVEIRPQVMEAKRWQPAGRKEAASEESFMFDAPRGVKAVATAMRGSQSWVCFGIDAAALDAAPGPPTA